MPNDERISSSDLSDQQSYSEGKLLAIWKKLLDEDEIDRHDRFLWLGGNSLKAIRLLHEIELTFSIRLSVSIIFKHDTIATLAAYLDRRPVPKDTMLPAYKAVVSTQPILPMSELQKGFYFTHEEQTVHHGLYNVALLLEITGNLDQNALLESLRYLVKRMLPIKVREST